MEKRRAVGGGDGNSPMTPNDVRTELHIWCRWREVSAARQALEAAVVARGMKRRLDLLQDPARRPRHPRAVVPDHIAQLQPDVSWDLDVIKFKKCLHAARRGAAAGPSGMTTDFLKSRCWNLKWTSRICTKSQQGSHVATFPKKLQTS